MAQSFTFPVWVVVNAAKYPRKGLARCTPDLAINGHRFVPIFRTEDAAKCFMAETSLTACRTLAIIDPAALAVMLRDLQALGVSDVGLDPSGSGGVFIPVADFIRSIAEPAAAFAPVPSRCTQ